MRKLFSVFLSLVICFNLLLPVPMAMATVSSETNSISYSCNGTSTAYTYTFRIFEDSDILAIKKLTSTGAETTLTLTTDYTVTGEGDAGGGTVTLTAGSVCDSGYTLTLTRNVDYKQETDYVEGDAFPADAHEDALDKLAMQVQQIKFRTDRAIKFPKTITTDQELPALETRKNRAIGFDSSGDLTMLVPTTDGVSTVLTQTNIFTAQQDFSAGFKTNTISEYTAGSGVTIDSVLLKDGGATLTNATLSGILNEASGATIASSTTTDIGAATGNYLIVSGTASISGLGTVQAGARRIVHFTGALTLVHNATSLILPTGANITTAAGDVATFVSHGSGNWKLAGYMKADGTALAVASTAPKVLHVREEQTSGTQAGGSSAGVQTRVLNTVVLNEITGASLASNQITLPAGTYKFFATVPGYQSLGTQAALYNVTDAAYTKVGPAVYISAQGFLTTVEGKFTIAAQKVFEIRQFVESAVATYGLGYRSGSSMGNEVYTEIFIEKL